MCKVNLYVIHGESTRLTCLQELDLDYYFADLYRFCMQWNVFYCVRG